MATASQECFLNAAIVIGLLSLRAQELQAVSAPQIHAPTPGLGLHGKLAEDPGANLGVVFAGAKLFGLE